VTVPPAREERTDPVLRISPSDQSGPAHDPEKAPVPRLFGRPRPLPVDEPAPPPIGPAGLPTPPDGELVLPIDSAKTFIGPNGTYYDDHWRWMDWMGRSRSWNWAAATTFGGWLAYRRLYRLAALHLAWLGLLLAAALHGVPLPLIGSLLIAGAVVLGLYGNTLYFRRFKRAAVDVAQRHAEHRARLEALAAAGGTSQRAVWTLAGAGALVAILVVALSRVRTGEIELLF
jgi:hypothetical protein